MKFDTTHRDRVVIGSNTEIEQAFQVCNFLNMMYSNIHYSDDKETFSSGYCMKISVVSHNLGTYFDAIVRFRERRGVEIPSQKFRLHFEAIAEELKRLELEKYPEDEVTKAIKNNCDRALLSGYRALQEIYPEYGFIVKE